MAGISAVHQMFPVLFCSPPCREVRGHVTAPTIEMPLQGGSFKSQGEIHHVLCPSVQVTRNISLNQHGSHGENNIKQTCDGCGIRNNPLLL